MICLRPVGEPAIASPALVDDFCAFAAEAVAGHVGLSPSHFQHVFKRWAGLTPKAFLQAITIERARELLRDSARCSTRPTTSASRGRAGCTTCSSRTRR